MQSCTVYGSKAIKVEITATSVSENKIMICIWLCCIPAFKYHIYLTQIGLQHIHAGYRIKIISEIQTELHCANEWKCLKITFNWMLPFCKFYHVKEHVVMIKIIRINSRCLLSLCRPQLHTSELGLCQSGFPCSARLVLSVCLHTEEACVNGRAGDMNEGGRVGQGPCIVLTFPQATPTGGTVPQMPSLLHVCHNRKQRD